MKNIFYTALLFLSIKAVGQPNFIGSLAYDGPQFGGVIYKFDMPGATNTIIHQFNNLSPHKPESALTPGDADWYYGTMRFNGNNNHGALYRIKRDGTGFTILHEMQNVAGPTTRPYFHSDGKIYFSDETELLQYDPSTANVTTIGSVSSIYTRNLYIDADDWIYLATGIGTLEKIKTDGTNHTVLHTFNLATEGYNSVAGVTEIPGDTLFGVLLTGGTLNGGAIYSIKKDGTGFTIHQSFDITNPFDPIGAQPESKLVLYDGRLFGTTIRGGAAGVGVLYTLNTDGSGYRILTEFPEGFNGYTDVPSGDISITSNARIIGAFSQFTSFQSGLHRFYKVDTSGTAFEGFGFLNQRENGNSNNTPMLLDDETILYTTQTMGRHDGGVFNETDTSGFTTSHLHFGASPNGFRPGQLIKGSDGKLYGTTEYGGTNGNGTIFAINQNGSGYMKLHEFTDAEGYQPQGKLLEASDGKLYGALAWGGPIGTGALYRIDKNGTNFQIIYTFPTATDGYSPVGYLVEDAGGFLYGSTNYNGNVYGAVFRINKDGTGYTVLRNFAAPDIGYPLGGLKLHMGVLYGIGYFGGASNLGGIFKMNTDGTGYQLLHSFSGIADGSNPTAPPIVANDGKLYGGALFGGANSAGTLYRMDIDGNNFTVIKHLSSSDVQFPQFGIIQASDGLLYGTGFATLGTGIFKSDLTGTTYNTITIFNTQTEGQFGTAFLEVSTGSLPVVLTRFQVQKQNEKALVSWQTAHEENSKLFEVERSLNGTTFTTIGSVAAKGNSTSLTSYTFVDASPWQGKNYYRLRQVDNDATFTYSPIRTLLFTKESKTIIYPNPAVTLIQIQLPAVYSTVQLQIVNSEGRLMKKMTVTNSDQVEIPISSYPAGRYMIRIYSGNKVETVSFIKQTR